ncbi:FtsK/SpoIIIE domain-containing protein [Arthrobacter sp. MDT2-2]
MELHVTLASGPPTGFPSREIVVDTDALPTGAALADRLAAAGYLGPFAVDGVPLTTLVPHVGGLVDGAIIVSGSRAEEGSPAPVPPLVFVVHSGPDAGQVIPLTRGSYTIGRSGSDIVVSDPAVSRNHALLTVTEDSIVLEDLGSVNGTFVDGEGITRAPITVAANLRLGASRCRIELIDDEGWKAAPTPDLLEPLPVGPDLPHRPSRVLVLTALLPLVVGVLLALTTGMWFFLAFSALSAATGLVPLLTYRRSARIFEPAVHRAAEQDRVRRARVVPDPGQTALDALRACRQGPRRPGGPPPAPDVLLLRLGTAHQPAHLSVGRDKESFAPPILPDLPLVLHCTRRGQETGGQDFTIVGDTGAVQALARAVLLQLAHPESGAPPVLCWGSAADVPHSARFLPNVRLTRDPVVLAPLIGQAGVRLVLQFSPDLPHLPRAPGVFVVRFAGERGSPASASGSHAAAGGAMAGAGMTLAAGGARARIDGREYDVLPDGVSARTFERAARTLARAAAGAARPAASGAAAGKVAVPPRSASLWSRRGSPDDLATTAPGRWSSAHVQSPRAYLGESGSGPLSIDLVRDGPHLLVAGTTGSGKSEFLRTFVLGLALDQAPEHLALLLIDYKGGSGLGILAALPHCVGCLTDLSTESTGRALISLRAELRRREQLCAEHGAYGLVELRRASPSSCPPRLVVVIDEFRMLSDEVPTAVPDLMKIAALGRSLGVHLVLATQRAQGAVTPDIRANITSSVLLRVQTAGESQDLLGSAAAADISIDLPGRAFLRRGTEPPIAFQVASCSYLSAPAGSPGWQDLAAYLGGGHRNGPRPAADDPAPPVDGTVDGAAGIGSRDPSDTAEHGDTAEHSILQRAAGNIAAAALRHAAPSGPRHPVLPPLPAMLSPAGCSAFLPADPPSSAASPRPAAIALGVADFPDRQEQRLLQWRPGDHSHLAFVGLPGSGANKALGSAVVSLLSDPHVHLYLLDGDGTLAGHAFSLRVGAHVQPHETKRAARVLERLSALPVGRQDDKSFIVLVITGWGRWSSQFRTGRAAHAEDDLHAVVRDGARSGVTVLVDGDRDLTSSRFFALLPNRVYLPLGAHAEMTMTWPKLPPVDAVAGRGLVQGRITGSWGDGACQLVLDPGTVLLPDGPPARPPFPVHPLPLSVPLGRLAARREAGTECGGLLLGVSGDDLRPYCVNVRPGEVYLVLGHASSGRTNALRVLAASAALPPRRAVLAPPEGAGREEAAAFWRGIAERRARAAPPERCILVVDDADQLPGDAQQALSGLVASGAAAVLSAPPNHALLARVPLSLLARGTGRGFVLSPRSPGDGDFFGVRLDVDGTPIPGRGYACDPAHVVEVQVALAPGADAAGPDEPDGPTASYRSRSSAP